MPSEGLRPENLYGPDERQAVMDYLTGAGFVILLADWRADIRRLDIVARERGTAVVFDIRRPLMGELQPLHDITHARQWQLRLLAAGWLEAVGQAAAPVRIDVLGLSYSRLEGYAVQHARDVGKS